MFKYTKASIGLLIDDCKRYAKIFKYVSLIATLGLLTYQIVVGFMKGSNLVYFNIAIAVAFLTFAFVDLLFKNKSLKRTVKRIYKWLKIILKAITLGITIYEIYIADTVDGIQIILTILMILLWIASFISEVVVEVVQIRANEILVAVKQDIDDVKKPITAVSNVFKKITGQEVEVKPVDEKKEKILAKLRRRINKDE